jgi:hypothetical protein
MTKTMSYTSKRIWYPTLLSSPPHCSHLSAATLSATCHTERGMTIKVISLADSICLQLLSWFGSPIIKKFPEYHPPNVYGYVEMWMYIMSKYSTIPNCSNFDFRNDDRYKYILLSLNCSQAFIAQSVRRRIFDQDVRGSYSIDARIFAVMLPSLSFCTFKCSFILLWNFLLAYLKM